MEYLEKTPTIDELVKNNDELAHIFSLNIKCQNGYVYYVHHHYMLKRATYDGKEIITLYKSPFCKDEGWYRNEYYYLYIDEIADGYVEFVELYVFQNDYGERRTYVWRKVKTDGSESAINIGATVSEEKWQRIYKIFK